MGNITFDSNLVNRWRIHKEIMDRVNVYSIIIPVTLIFNLIIVYDDNLLCSDLVTRVPI